MSELGQSRQIGRVPVTSGLPRTTDIIRTSRHVSNVPRTEHTARALKRPHCRWRSGQA
jgi:hypothetical protein